GSTISRSGERHALPELRNRSFNSSKRLEKSNERPAVVRRKVQPELMPFHRARLHADTAKSRRDVIILDAPKIEPIFKRRHRAAVLKRPAIPDPFERWHFVIARASPGLHR